MGYYLGTMKKKIPGGLLVSAAAADLVLITFGTWHESRAAGEYITIYQSQSSGPEIFLAGCIFVFFLQYLNRDCRMRRLLLPSVTMSLGIYAFHNFLLSWIHHYILPVPRCSQVLPLTIVVFIISYVVIKTLTTIPVLSYLTAGIPFPAADNSANWIYTCRKLRHFISGHFGNQNQQ